MLWRNLYQLSRDCRTMAELKQILAQIVLTGISNHPSSLSAILSFSATSSSHGDLQFASSLFACIERPSSFAYNSMIRGFSASTDPKRALLLYLRMNCEKPISDKFTFPFVLKACAALFAVEFGTALHGKILQLGFASDPFIRSGLVSMYSEFGQIGGARKVFDEYPERDSVLWNSMIGGYFKCGVFPPACDLFESMPDKNVGSFNAMIGGYVKFGFMDDADELFNQMPNRDIISWNTMIGAHARFGNTAAARGLFNEAPERLVTTWSSFISGLAQSSRFEEGLQVFKEMVGEGVKPNQAILVSVLSSCAHLGALEQGIWIHGYIEKQGIELDDILGASLIDMYTKCGLLQGAIVLFHKIVKKGVCVWTSMMHGYAIHGYSLKAMELFSQMESMEIRPNDITFVAILCACSHAGLVDKGREILDRMSQVYKMRPRIEHYTCMVDLLSRANLLDEAQELIKSMPMEPDVLVWGALLSGFQIHGGSCLENGDIRNELARLEPRDSGAYVLMSNLYASTDQWDEVLTMRRMMVASGLRKNPGCSLIEVSQAVHEFLAGGRLHPQTVQLYDMLDQIYRDMGLKVSYTKQNDLILSIR